VHLEQAIPVFKAGKTVFIDKPIAGSLTDAITLFQAAQDFKVPMFSSSSLRFHRGMVELLKNQSIGKIFGAETFGPCSIETTHPDFYWYGIHGIELLFTVMGLGCQTVSRVHTPDTDVAVGVWEDNRIGSYRGFRKGSSRFGGHVFGEKKIETIGDGGGYNPLLVEIAKFFQSGVPPVSAEETLEIFTFMDAAEESKNRGGAAVYLAEIRQKALAQVRKIW
jgi:predicted dehydrogenase